MTQPNPAGGGDSPTADTSRRYRPGQIAVFLATDPTSGQEFTGHGVVLKVDGDVADVAVIGTAHVRVPVDKLAPAKVDDVPNLLPAPEPAEGSAD